VTSSTSTPPTRPGWDATWMAAAAAIGETRSLCTRDKVGCVVVDPANRVVATGYNGPARGYTLPQERPCIEWCARAFQAQALLDYVLAADYGDCPSLHAEANALMVGDARDRLGGTLYVTSDVCLSCAKLISNSGIARVVARTTSADAIRRGSESGYRNLVMNGLQVVLHAGS
jgi:dCMP deaminase